jgi:hypothetical protein
MNGQNKLEGYITLGWKELAGDKHSNLLGLIVRYEENIVL